MILCEDCDLENVFHIAMRGVYQNAGQNCCGIERIYVYESVRAFTFGNCALNGGTSFRFMIDSSPWQRSTLEV
jgi:hypothetical protein